MGWALRLGVEQKSGRRPSPLAVTSLGNWGRGGWDETERSWSLGPWGRKSAAAQVEPGAVTVFLVGWTPHYSQRSLRRVGGRGRVGKGKGHSFSLPPL